MTTSSRLFGLFKRRETGEFRQTGQIDEKSLPPLPKSPVGRQHSRRPFNTTSIYNTHTMRKKKWKWKRKKKWKRMKRKKKKRIKTKAFVVVSTSSLSWCLFCHVSRTGLLANKYRKAKRKDRSCIQVGQLAILQLTRWQSFATLNGWTKQSTIYLIK